MPWKVIGVIYSTVLRTQSEEKTFHAWSIITVRTYAIPRHRLIARDHSEVYNTSSFWNVNISRPQTTPASTAEMATPHSSEYATQSNTSIVLIPCAVFLAVSPVTVGIRLWSRFRTGAKIGADDLTICVSSVRRSFLSSLLATPG